MVETPKSITAAATTTSNAFLFTAWTDRTEQTLPVYFQLPVPLNQLSGAEPVLIALADHHRNAKTHCTQWQEEAVNRNIIIVCPQFRQSGWPSTLDYETGGVYIQPANTNRPNTQPLQRHSETDWAYTAIQALFDTLVADLNLEAQTYSLYGHGSGGGFVHRFLYHKPTARLAKAAVANVPWYTLAQLNIAHPYGLANTGISTTNLKTALSRPLTILAGHDNLIDISLAINQATIPPAARTTQAQAQGSYIIERSMNLILQAATTVYQQNQPPATNKTTLNWTLRSVSGAGYANQEMVQAAAESLYD